MAVRRAPGPAGVAMVLVLSATPGFTQPAEKPPPTQEPTTTTWIARNWSRVELWDFFEPPPGGGNPDYAYLSNRLQLGLRHSAPRYEATAVLQYVQFAGLPKDASGPGPLGLGAVYFGHAGRSDSRQVYLRYLNIRLKNLTPGLSVQAGRLPYTSGAEIASGDPKIEAVKRQRVDSRLLGEFEWSIYQRGYDGFRADLTRPAWSATAIAFRPTQGGFEDAAGVTIDDIDVVGGSATLKPGTAIPRTEWQIFAYRYNDGRAVTMRPDNSGRSAATVDIGVNTFGITLVAASPATDGRQWDGLLWFAGQTGSWYGERHRAYSVAAEIGYQWSAAPWRPWLRAGVLRASGDDNPADDRHGTFFQMLPTVRRYSLSASYSQMNNIDLFVQTLLRPRPSLGLRLDLHRLSLVSSRDRWYFGSGATQERGSTFGFGTRTSNGATSLGTVIEGSADYTVDRHWTVGGYLGVLRGAEVVRRSFAGRTLTFAYLENVVQF